MPDTATTHADVREYYGKILRAARDLKTGACCPHDSLPPHLRRIVDLIDPEIIDRFYGCGTPIPSDLAGRTVLDLGCGTGRDAFVVSRLVGESGRVIGVDMTEEQLEVARRHTPAQMKRFGFAEPNVEFVRGYIEDLVSVGLADESVDVALSNCVINLSPDKKRVFAEIFRVLRPGGELCFADIFAGRRVPEELSRDLVLRGECLGGAMYLEDFRRLLRDLGCLDHRVLSRRRVTLNNPEIEARAGMIDFYSLTVRAFKLDSLEDICEDYGQVVVYRGTLPESPHAFALDEHHVFSAGKPTPVCGNTASMLAETRFARHFEVIGDRRVHYGAFDCAAGGRDSHSSTGGTGTCC